MSYKFKSLIPGKGTKAYTIKEIKIRFKIKVKLETFGILSRIEKKLSPFKGKILDRLNQTRSGHYHQCIDSTIKRP